jgi:hypothetical protein
MRKTKLLAVISVILVAAVAATLILLFAFLRYHKSAVEAVIGQALGATVEIDAISIDLKNSALRITGFKLHNPKDFSEETILAYVPRITGRYDPGSLFVNNKLHFTALDLYVKTMVVIKNKSGKLNIDQLAIFKENFQEIPIETDRLILTADYAVYKDLSKGDLPHIETFEIGIRNEAYEGFPSIEDITAKVTAEILRRTTIRGSELIGIAVLAGAAGGWSVLIPAEAVVVLSKKDSYQATFDVRYEDAYAAGLEAARELGKKVHEHKNEGTITGYINDADVTIKIKKRQDNKTDIVVSARKLYLPRLNVAGGVLYEIASRLWIRKGRGA